MTVAIPDDVTMMEGPGALPRDNGEIVFAAPWEARAVAVAVALVERLGLSWDDFRVRLVSEITDAPERPYYESWACALERLVVDLELMTAPEIAQAEPLERSPL